MKVIKASLWTIVAVIFCSFAWANEIPTTYSWGFPAKGNWWGMEIFGFGEYNSAFGSHHLAVDTNPGLTPYGTHLFAPCTGQVVISDNNKFSYYGASTSANPNYKGYALVIQCKTMAGQYYTVLLGHVQAGSNQYNAQSHTGLAPLGAIVYKGQYVAKIDHYWQDATFTYDTPHVHFGIRQGFFDPENPAAFVKGYDSADWKVKYTEHNVWQEPTKFVINNSMQASWHPNGSLVQAYGDNDIHIIIDQAMHHIADEDVFNAHKFAWDKVIFISDDEYHCLAKGELQIDWQPYREIFEYQGQYYLFEKSCKNCDDCTLYQFSSTKAMQSWGHSAADAKHLSAAEANDWSNFCQTGKMLYLRDSTIVKPEFIVPGFGSGAIFLSHDNGVLSPFLTESAFWLLGYDYDELVLLGEGEFYQSFQYYGEVIADSHVLSCGQQYELQIASVICTSGELIENYSGLSGTKNIGQCQGQVQICNNNEWLVIQEEKLPALEVLDNQDNDCDGQTDENLQPEPEPQPDFAKDNDSDGYTPEDGDCDDNNYSIHPLAPEKCDNLDNDCDTEIDEDLLIVCQTECGFGDQQCVFGQWGPCEVDQFFEEVCDGIDNDCDNIIDEGCLQPDPEPDPWPIPEDDLPADPQSGSEIICTVSCPAGFVAHVWYADGQSQGQPGSVVVQTDQAEVCQRGQPWMDYNCALTDWSAFDPLLATIECNCSFTYGLGVIDFCGEGEIWFTDFICYE